MKKGLSIILCICLLSGCVAAAEETGPVSFLQKVWDYCLRLASGDGKSMPETEQGVKDAGKEETIAEAENNTSDTDEMLNRLTEFFECWSMDRQDIMIQLCSPDWKWNEENPRVSLFMILDSRKALEATVLNASGEEGDTVRSVMVSVLIDHNDGQPAEEQQFTMVMEKGEDGLWYIDPTGLESSVTEPEADQPTAKIVPVNGAD